MMNEDKAIMQALKIWIITLTQMQIIPMSPDRVITLSQEIKEEEEAEEEAEKLGIQTEEEEEEEEEETEAEAAEEEAAHGT